MVTVLGVSTAVVGAASDGSVSVVGADGAEVVGSGAVVGGTDAETWSEGAPAVRRVPGAAGTTTLGWP